MCKVHVRVDKSGEDALSVAIDDFCGIAYPYGYACLVTYKYELAVLDSNGFCMCLLSIQCDGINDSLYYFRLFVISFVSA